jgi:hypothetical protein
MGNCFGCYQYYAINKSIIDKNNLELSKYTIIIKLPHGKKCYQIKVRF